MKNASKLVIMVTALVIALAVATTTAFAWFTLNTLVSIKGIELDVDTNEGIKVSTTEDGVYAANVELGINKALTAVTPLLANTTYYIVIEDVDSAYDLLTDTEKGAYISDTAELARLNDLFDTVNQRYINVTSALETALAADTDFVPQRGVHYMQSEVKDGVTTSFDNYTFYNTIDDTPSEYDLLADVRPTDSDVGFDAPQGTYKDDYAVNTTLDAKTGLTGAYYCDVTTDVIAKINAYVKAPARGVDFQYSLANADSGSYQTYYYNAIDSTSDEYTTLVAERPTDPAVGFDAPLGTYQDDYESNAILVANEGLAGTYRFLDVTDQVNAKNQLHKDNPLPVRGVDFDLIDYGTDDLTWDTDYEFINLAGQTLGDVNDTDKGWYVQDFYFRSGTLTTDVYLDSVRLTGVNVTGEPSSRAINTIGANTFGTHAEYAPNDLVEGEIEAAIRIAFFDDNGALIAVYSFADGMWETKNADGINMAGLIYNQVFANQTMMADNSQEMANMTRYNDTLDLLGTTTRSQFADDNTEYQLHLTMVVWLEGKDGDCLDSILNDNLRLQIGFTGLQVEE